MEIPSSLIFSFINTSVNIISKLLGVHKLYTLYPYISNDEGIKSLFIKITPSNKNTIIEIDEKPILLYSCSFKFTKLLDWTYSIYQETFPYKSNEKPIPFNNIKTIVINDIDNLKPGLYKLKITTSGNSKTISYMFTIPLSEKKLQYHTKKV